MTGKHSLALVTGATSGIGTALCHLLASKGIHLIMTGRDQKRLEEISEELGRKVNVITFSADLSQHEGREQVIEKIRAHTPDLIINCAGFGLYGDALTFPTKDQLNILEVNGNAVLEITLEAARTLMSREVKGTILNVSSSAGYVVFPTMAVYSASKTFVNYVSLALDMEVKKYGIRILAACPGVVKTQFSKRAGGKGSPPKGISIMNAEFAAKQIWWQIEKQKPIHVFDTPTRIGIFLAKFIPKKWLGILLRSEIEGRHIPREVIKNP